MINGDENGGGSSRPLTDIEKMKVQTFCEEIWARAWEVLKRSKDQAHFDLLMGQEVLEKVKATPSHDRNLVLAAAEVVQSRMHLQLSSAINQAREEMKGEE